MSTTSRVIVDTGQLSGGSCLVNSPVVSRSRSSQNTIGTTTISEQAATRLAICVKDAVLEEQ